MNNYLNAQSLLRLSVRIFLIVTISLLFSEISIADKDMDDLHQLRAQQLKKAKEMQSLVEKMQQQNIIPEQQQSQQQPPTAEHQNHLNENDEGMDINQLNSTLAKVKKTFGINDETAKGIQENFLKYGKPIYDKIIKIATEPSVMAQIMSLAQMRKRNKLIAIQLIFIACLFLYKMHLSSKSKGFIKAIKNSFKVFVMFWIGSTLIVPLIVYGSPYKDLLVLIYKAF
jgi:hypothetical protein